jgi:hypothetical protein
MIIFSHTGRAMTLRNEEDCAVGNLANDGTIDAPAFVVMEELGRLDARLDELENGRLLRCFSEA